MKKILITGSKGKTSMTMFIDSMVKNSLVVNSEFLRIKENNKEKYFKSSKELISLYKTIPTWTPFKFLILKDFFNFDYYIAETDINNAFCSVPGISIGTKKVDIGILTNVFREHIDGKLIPSYEKLIEAKLKLLFEASHYQEGYRSDLIINVNSQEVFDVLVKTSLKYKNKNYRLLLAINDSLKIDVDKLPNVEKIIYYNKRSFDGKDIKDYKLSFNGLYYPAASILSILYLVNYILKLNVNIKNITFPRGLGRMDLVKKNGNLFIIDHISEKESFKGLIELVKKYFKGKKINLIFTLKYDALEEKINVFSDYLNKLLNEGVISKLYLYDSLQVRGKSSIKTRTGQYKAFELINKLSKKIKKAEILKDRDKKIKQILSKPHQDEIFILALNSIESDYLKKTFNLY